MHQVMHQDGSCLLVGVEAGCGNQGLLDQGLRRDGAELAQGRRRELDSLHCQRDGRQEEEGHDRDQGEEVDVAAQLGLHPGTPGPGSVPSVTALLIEGAH